MKTQKKISTYMISSIGIMSAVSFISNFFSIPIGDITRIHFGNGFCVLSGLLLGPWAGGVSAGLGAFFYDLTNPLYARDALITFMMKFVLGFVSGYIVHRIGKHSQSNVLRLTASSLASISYVAVYLFKNFVESYFFLRQEMETVLIFLSTKLAASTTNAIISVIVAMMLYPVFKTAMTRSGIDKKITP